MWACFLYCPIICIAFEYPSYLRPVLYVKENRIFDLPVKSFSWGTGPHSSPLYCLLKIKNKTRSGRGLYRGPCCSDFPVSNTLKVAAYNQSSKTMPVSCTPRKGFYRQVENPVFFQVTLDVFTCSMGILPYQGTFSHSFQV